MIAVVYQINRVGIYLPLLVRFVSCLPPSSRLAILPSKASHGCIPGKARRSCDGLYPHCPHQCVSPSFGFVRAKLTVCSDSVRPGEDQVADPTCSNTSAFSLDHHLIPAVNHLMQHHVSGICRRLRERFLQRWSACGKVVCFGQSVSTVFSMLSGTFCVRKGCVGFGKASGRHCE